MSRPLVLRPEAEAELDEAAASRNPLQFPLITPSVRRAVLRRFPYSKREPLETMAEKMMSGFEDALAAYARIGRSLH